MSRPTAEECATARTRYAEASEAEHKLRTGALEVAVRMGEKSVEYTRASLPDLSSYVALLKSRVDRCDGCWGHARRVIGIAPK